MYVSIYATTHPIEFGGFLALEREAFAGESMAALERRAIWQPDALEIVIDLVGVPEEIVDYDITRIHALVA